MSQSVADRLDANTGREWSDAELRELGNMLVFGLSIEAIARLLGRDKAEVRGKIAEIGRVCHPTAPGTLNRRGL